MVSLYQQNKQKEAADLVKGGGREALHGWNQKAFRKSFKDAVWKPAEKKNRQWKAYSEIKPLPVLHYRIGVSFFPF